VKQLGKSQGVLDPNEPVNRNPNTRKRKKLRLLKLLGENSLQFFT
jgi:hypothetical protein